MILNERLGQMFNLISAKNKKYYKDTTFFFPLMQNLDYYIKIIKFCLWRSGRLKFLTQKRTSLEIIRPTAYLSGNCEEKLLFKALHLFYRKSTI